MSSGICSCTSPTFGNTGRANCVIEQKALAFPIIVPRFDSTGARNTIDISLAPAALWAAIQAKINAIDPRDRWYPLPRVENATFPRTDDVYEEAPSGRKVLIDGVGGVRTWNMELWAKDAVANMHRELAKFGCSDLDVYYVDVAGLPWGIKDNLLDTVLRGYEMSTETYNVFAEYATDTTTRKLMLSWDLDNQEVEDKSYAITVDEMDDNKATSLSGLVTGYQTLVEPSDGVINLTAYMGFGSAGSRSPIVGLVGAAPVLTLFNVNSGLFVTPPTGLAAVVGSDGDYTMSFTPADIGIGEIGRLSIDGVAGYDFVDGTFTGAF